MTLDLILVAVLAFFIVVGLIRGGLASSVSLLTILLAYAGGVLGAQHLADPLMLRLGVSGFLATPLAGLAGFFLSYGVFGLLGRWLTRWNTERLADEETGSLDRLLGATVGGLHGCLVVLLLGWLAIWVDAARDLDVLSFGNEQLPQAEDSRLADLTSRIVENVVVRSLSGGEPGRAGSDPGVRVVTRLLANPGQSLTGLRDLLEDDRIGKLQEDRMFWVLIENGASDNALNRVSFYQISHDEGLRRSLADLGVISEDAAKSVTAFHDEVVSVFDEVGPRLKGLREDPEILEMSKDPEIIAMLEKGETLSLIQRPEIQRLVERIAGN